MSNHLAGSASAVAKHIEELYEGPVRLHDLQARLLNAAYNGEAGGPTPEKDQKIQEMLYAYLSSGEDGIDPSVARGFSPILAWICTGKELSKMLSLAPRSSLEGLIRFAEKKGFDVEVSSRM